MIQKQEKKYIILENETLEHNGRTLYRIQALKDFSDVKAGDKGGWIEKEENLSQEDYCWIYDEAKVYNNACIIDKARIRHNAEVYGNAKIFVQAWIYDNAKVCENSEIYDEAHVYGFANISGNAKVFGKALIYENTIIADETQVYGTMQVCYKSENIGNDVTKKYSHYVIFKNHWSSGKVDEIHINS